MGLRWNTEKSELRRPMSLPEVLACFCGGRRLVRGRGAVSGARESGGGTIVDTGALSSFLLMAAIVPLLGSLNSVEGSFRTRVGARPSVWITVT
jgi:hypothetical protein